jgi:catechol 2,3-dioxygenase-like lactoylglutathione lyase family enzyme
LEFHLSHVGLLTDQVDQVMGFYTHSLGMVGSAREGSGRAFLGIRGGGAFRIQVHGPPWSDEVERRSFEERGSCLDRLHFSVTDVAHAYQYLRARGCTPRLAPTGSPPRWEAAVYDPQGIEIWLGECPEEGKGPFPLFAASVESDLRPAFAARLHHVGILTPDRQTAVDFYTRVMGLEIRRRFYSPGVVDVTYLMDNSGCGSFLQIEGPPHLAYEEQYLVERGPGVNHLHFLVDDMGAARTSLLATDARENIVPYTIDGVQAALFFDPFGIDLQFTDSPPASLPL